MAQKRKTRAGARGACKEQNRGKQHTVAPVSALPDAHVANTLGGGDSEVTRRSEGPFQAMHCHTGQDTDNRDTRQHSSDLEQQEVSL